MKRVYSSRILPDVQITADKLQERGIVCTLRNTTLSSLAGDVPFTEVFPEIWVEDEQEEEALSVLCSLASETQKLSEGDTWECRGCGEVNEPQFSDCWKCSHAKD